MMSNNPESLLNALDRLESQQETDRHAKSQRQFKRFVIRGDAELHPMNRNTLNTTPIEVKLRNVGRGGIGFLSTQPLEAHSTWRMVLMNQGYKIGEQALIVRFTQLVDDNVYLVGGQFVIDTGLMVLLGVEVRSVMEDMADTQDDASTAGFIPPAEVA